MDKELTPKQQTSEAIRQAETILIMTGQHPSIDQVASTIALAALLRKFGKKVTAVVSDEIPAGAKFLPTNLVEHTLGGLRDFIVRLDLSHAELDKLKYTIEDRKLNVHITPFAGGFQQRDVSFDYGDYQFDLVLVLGVASYARIDKLYAQNAELLRRIPLINIDFHRSNEQYGAINLVEGTAASLSEILIALSESLQAGMINEQIATTMLTGIMAATDRFTATHTTAKTMTVAAQMMAMGADQQKIVRGLYRDRPDSRGRDTRDQKPAPRVEAPRPTTQPAPRPQATPVVRQASATPQPVVQEAPRPTPNAVYQQPVNPPAPVPTPSATNPVAVQPPLPVPTPRPTPPAPRPAATPVVPRASGHPTDTMPLPRTPAAPVAAPTPSVVPAAPAPDVDPDPPMEELLPPHHIELSDLPGSPDSEDLLPEAAPGATMPTPEPLINDTANVRPASPPAPRPTSQRAANPTNNPVFAQRLDEFSY